MHSEDNPQDERYPWLSWAATGVLTLAGVLIFGLVLSAAAAGPGFFVRAAARRHRCKAKSSEPGQAAWAADHKARTVAGYTTFFAAAAVKTNRVSAACSQRNPFAAFGDAGRGFSAGCREARRLYQGRGRCPPLDGSARHCGLEEAS